MSKLTVKFTVLAALVLTAFAPVSALNAAPAPAETAQLTAVLKSNASRKDKADACRQLAVIGTQEAVAPLAELLANPEMSHMARYALEPMPHASVNEALRQALGSAKGLPLAGVISSLGVRKDAQAVEGIARLLSDANTDVVQASARALGSIGGPAAAKALQGALAGASAQNHVAVCEGLFRCAEGFGRAGQNEQAIPLFDLLRGQKAPQQVRTGALRGAILARGKGGLGLLQESVASSDYHLFTAAVRTAQEIPGTEVTALLTSALPKLAPDNQVVVLQTLGLRQDPAALNSATAATKSPDPAVRIAAIRALGSLGQAASIPTLLALIGAADRPVSEAAQEALAASPAPEVDGAIKALLAGSSSQQQVIAMDLASRRRMLSLVPELMSLARSGESGVRVAAIRRAGELAAPDQAGAFLDLLSGLNSAPELDAAEQALSSLCARAENPAPCAEQITARLAQAQPTQKGALLRVLSGIGGTSALQAVRTALKDSNTDVRAAAIRALGAWKTADAAPDLLALAQSGSTPTEKTLSLRNYIGLAGQSDLPVNERLAICEKAAGLIQRSEEKRMLLSALSNINSPESVRLAQAHLNDASVREEASAAIVGVAERLLRGKQAAKFAAELVQPLENAAAAASPDLAQRAKTLLQEARKRSGRGS